MTGLTEEKARTKWCPFARSYDVPDEHPATVNRNVNGGDPWCFCLASACMAWRWSRSADPRNVPLAEARGYCGLAGRLSQ